MQPKLTPTFSRSSDPGHGLCLFLCLCHELRSQHTAIPAHTQCISQMKKHARAGSTRQRLRRWVMDGMPSQSHLSRSLALSLSLSLSLSPPLALRSLSPSPLALFDWLSFDRFDDDGEDLSLPAPPLLLPARSRSRDRLRLLRLLDDEDDDD